METLTIVGIGLLADAAVSGVIGATLWRSASGGRPGLRIAGIALIATAAASGAVGAVLLALQAA